MDSGEDAIEKRVVLPQPLSAVWRSIAQAERFGHWFGARFDAPFVAGSPTQGRIEPTRVDEEVAATQRPYRGIRLALDVEELEPMRRFSYRWHPFAVHADVDYSAEEKTRVVFDLQEVPGGTQLTIRESGFERLPPARRGPARAAHESGWQAQLGLIAKYLARDGT